MRFWRTQKLTTKDSKPSTSQSKASVSDLNEPLVHSEHTRDLAKVKIVAQYGLVPPRTHVNAPVGHGLGGSFENLVPLSGPMYWI